MSDYVNPVSILLHDWLKEKGIEADHPRYMELVDFWLAGYRSGWDTGYAAANEVTDKVIGVLEAVTATKQ